MVDWSIPQKTIFLNWLNTWSANYNVPRSGEMKNYRELSTWARFSLGDLCLRGWEGEQSFVRTQRTVGPKAELGVCRGSSPAHESEKGSTAAGSAASFRESAWQPARTETTVSLWPNRGSDVPSPLLSAVLRSESQNLAHTEGEGVTRGHKCQGNGAWGVLLEAAYHRDLAQTRRD